MNDGSNGIASDSRKLDTIPAPGLVADELPAMRFASPALEDAPELARPFDLNSRLKGALGDYERGKALLVEVEAQQAAAVKEFQDGPMKTFNEQRQTIARELLRIEGAITILKEQGATHE